MTILTKANVSKNQAASFSLNKEELALVASVVGNNDFANPSNWKTIKLSYETPIGKQREIVMFDATGEDATTTGEFLVSEKARDEFLLRKITIEDFDGGRHEIMRDEVNAEEFDVFFNLITGYSLYLTGPTSSYYTVGLPKNTPTYSMQRVPGMDANDIASIAFMADTDMLVVKSDGTLWGIGYNNRGELGLGHRNAVDVFTQVGIATDWKSVFSNANSFYAIKTDNTLWGSGVFSSGTAGNGGLVFSTFDTNNTFVQLNSTPNWKMIGSKSSLSTEYSSEITFAIKTDGTLWATGLYTYSMALGLPYPGTSTWTQVGADTDWKNVISQGRAAIALKENGKIYVTGTTSPGYWGPSALYLDNIRPSGFVSNVFTEIESTVIENVSHISSTHAFSFMVVKNNGTLWAIGDNDSGGILGLGDTSPRNNAFIQVGSDADWESVELSQNNSIAKKTNGQVYSAGANYGVGGSVSSSTIFVSDPSMPTAYKIVPCRTSVAYLRLRPAQALKNVFSAYNPNFKVGLTAVDSFLSYNASYISPISNTRVEPFYGFNDRDSVVNDNRSGQYSIQFNQKGSSISPNYIVIDLGQEYTFSSLYAFTPFDHSSYKGITRIGIDVASNGQLNNISSPNWTAVSYTNVAGELDNGYLIIPDVNTLAGGTATVGTFAPVTARYIRIKCYREGVDGGGYFYGMKLF